MENRDFEAERRAITAQVEKLDNEITGHENKIKTLTEKLKTAKQKRRRLMNQLTGVSRSEEKALRSQAALKERAVFGGADLENYANERGLLVIDTNAPQDAFFDAMKSRFKIDFYSPLSFYNLLSWLDESCQLTAENRKFLVKKTAAVNVIKKISRLKPDEVNEVEKAMMPKKGETAAGWKKRFFAFLLEPPFATLLSPQRKNEMNAWLRIDAIERPH